MPCIVIRTSGGPRRRPRRQPRGFAPAQAWALVVGAALLCGLAPGCRRDSDRTVTVSGTVVDAYSSQPVEGVEVCSLLSPSSGCSVTDALGQFSVVLPATGDHWILVDHATYYPVLGGVATVGEDLVLDGLVNLFPDEILDIVFGQVSIPLETGRGHVALWAYAQLGTGEGREQVTLAISPDPGGRLGYLDDQGLIDLDLTATSVSGVAGWVNIPPGDYVATVTHPDLECAMWYPFSTASAGTIPVKVLPDRFTYLLVICQ